MKDLEIERRKGDSSDEEVGRVGLEGGDNMAVGQNLRYFFSRVPYHLLKRLLRVTGGLEGF